LSVQQPLAGGGVFSIVCRERQLECSASGADGKPWRWEWLIVGGDRLKASLRQVTLSSIEYHYDGVDYRLSAKPGAGSFRRVGEGSVEVVPNSRGKLRLRLDSAN
jgi:hypothetical protein